MEKNKISPSTLCVHAGKIIDPNTNGMVTPIYTSTAFDYVDTSSLTYPRYFNTPNQKVVVEKLIALENGEDGLLTSSGMSAISSVLFGLMQKGDHALFDTNLYGGTYHAVIHELGRFGIEYSFIDGSEQSIRDSIQPNTKLLYFETPSNPLLEIIDLKIMASLGKELDLTTVIDNTFASPINQNPLEWGIDIVIHSGTKYLSGHSDIICGAIISSKSLVQQICSSATTFGGNVNANTAALLERSLKTLSIRVQKQNENASILANWLEKHQRIVSINYPGLSSHPGHQIASKQMKGFGGMMSFEVDSSGQDVSVLLKKLKIVHTSLSLGGIESIVSEPVKTSHSLMSVEEREKAGISDQLVRFSVGIEDVEDLINDFDQALS